MDRSKVIARKVDRRLVDTQEHHPHISLNMVVCPSKDLHQPGRWLINNPQPSTGANKVAMAGRLSNLLLVMVASRWAMEALLLQARVDMAVANLLPMRSGHSQLHNPLGTASKATRAEKWLFVSRVKCIMLFKLPHVVH